MPVHVYPPPPPASVRYPGSRLRVIAVTADAFEGTRDSCLAAGFHGWLAKPFRVGGGGGLMDAWMDVGSGSHGWI